MTSSLRRVSILRSGVAFALLLGGRFVQGANRRLIVRANALQESERRNLLTLVTFVRRLAALAQLNERWLC